MPLAIRFEKDDMEVAEQFTNFLSTVINDDHDNFRELRDLNNPALFWSNYLNNKDPMLRPSTDLKSLIEYALVIPVGSAEAELREDLVS